MSAPPEHHPHFGTDCGGLDFHGDDPFEPVWEVAA